MIRLLVVTALFGCAALMASPARAANDYTDTWWSTAEPGWGVNLAQQNNTIYVTFYVYGPDGKPVWYAALLLRDGTGDRFTGTLSRFTGTYFGAPTWQGNTSAPAGTATFTATSSTSGTLAYSVDSVNVEKSLERITLAPLNVAGTYIGGVSGRRSGCTGPPLIVDPIQIQILHSTLTGDIRIDQLSTVSGALFCRMEGTTTQTGKVLTVSNASYSCSDGWNGPARIFNLRPTPAGFEAQWFSDGGSGCTESGQLSGVTQFP
jgi:hypothetical protein